MRLGIDFGTSNTVAVLQAGDGSVRPLLFDGSPSLPSAVCRQPDGVLLVGRDAVHTARRYPEAFEPHPKRLVDERTALLGAAEVPVPTLIGAVLRRVADEAVRVGGREPSSVVLTHPVTWAAPRRGVLLAAASRAGLGSAELVPEPVAAAYHFTEAVPTGATAVVYDFGAGTFDASVLRRTADGFTVLATEGRTDTGGLDLDAAIVALLRRAADEPATWARLTEPITVDDRRAARQLWEDVRSAKEILSRTATTFVPVPSLGVDVPLGRPQFEELVGPIIEQTIDVTARAVRAAGAGDPAAILLVGGSSRIPLVATLLHRRFGRAPTVVEQPELVVAQGSVVNDDQPTVPLPPASVNDQPFREPVPHPDEPQSRRFSRRAVITSAVLGGGAALAAAGGFAYWQQREDPPAEVEVDYLGKFDESGRGIDVIAFSPTAEFLIAAGCSDGQVRFLDSTTRAQRGEPLTGHTAPVTAVAFSKDGRLLASADGSGAIQLWDVAAGAPVGGMGRPDGTPVHAIAFAPNGQLLGAGNDEGSVRFWNVATREPDNRPPLSATGPVLAMAFSVGGLLVGDGNGVRQWDMADRIEFGARTGHTDIVRAIAVHRDGRTIATASADSTVRLWDITGGPKGEPLQHGRGAEVDDVVFSPDGRTVISVSGNLRVRFWDTGTHQKVGDDIPVAATRLALDLSGKKLVAASTSDANVYAIGRKA